MLRATFASACLLSLAFVPTTAVAQSLSDLEPSKPLTLKQHGSFFVGGEQVFTDSSGWDLAGFGFAAGDITVDQMYVQFQVPPNAGNRVPIVFVHGCCLTSKTWETTPDGREGWYDYFTRSGYPTYLAEQAGRARSGFRGTIYNQVKKGQEPLSEQPPVLLATAEFAWSVFRFGPSFGTAWPDEQFPMDYVDELYKQVVPDMILTLVPNLFAELNDPSSTALPTPTHMATLANELGGAVLVGHSQSSGFPTKAALQDPSGVRGIIGLETGCFGNLTADQVDILKDIPILIVEGDHYSSPRPPQSCIDEEQQINAAGGDFTYIQLPNIGISGNSHMFMQDLNNLEVADVIIEWIEEHVGRQKKN